MQNKLLLLILDGFGINESDYGNAIHKANTKHINKFLQANPSAELKASGKDVGLLEGDMGNSEVGHLNIGAGRIVYQLNTLINKSIEDGSFDKNEQLLSAIKHVKENGSKLHLFGLLSDGNVHSNINHLFALLKFAKKSGLEEVYYHAFMDGRDTSPHAGIDFMKDFQNKAKEIGIGKIATISGRYYAMDRDTRWERTEKAYKAMVYGEGNTSNDPLTAIKKSYDKDVTDEFIIPTVIENNGKPVATISDNDAIIFFNFRSDRARQITASLKLPDFSEFEHEKFQNLKYITFNEYDVKFNPYVEVAFRLPELKNILGEVISKHNLNQLRLAETEKYAHVTFFFNGGSEEPFKNEDRILVPSPKVATYDLKPEMSAYEVKDKLCNALKSDKFDFIVTNFANCDMVGHTGDFEATIKAVESVDKCLGEIIPIAKQNNYNILLTADHGNADQMLYKNGKPFTAHSKNKVPIILSLRDEKEIELNNGILADIAPTILKIMAIEQPEEMSGKVLFE